MFYVRQLVVCVDDSPARDGSPSLLVRGRIYTVTGFYPAGGPCAKCICRNRVSDEDGLTVAEAAVPPHPTFCPAFRASRFRPVRAHSIEIFRALAKPAPTERELVGGDAQ